LSVAYRGLLYILKTYGIDGNLLAWFQNNLFGRSRRVVYRD